jgi:hypothetical protein
MRMLWKRDRGQHPKHTPLDLGRTRDDQALAFRSTEPPCIILFRYIILPFHITIRARVLSTDATAIADYWKLVGSSCLADRWAPLNLILDNRLPSCLFRIERVSHPIISHHLHDCCTLEDLLETCSATAPSDLSRRKSRSPTSGRDAPKHPAI